MILFLLFTPETEAQMFSFMLISSLTSSGGTVSYCLNMVDSGWFSPDLVLEVLPGIPKYAEIFFIFFL